VASAIATAPRRTLLVIPDHLLPSRRSAHRRNLRMSREREERLR
jgi:hypothetical protein